MQYRRLGNSGLKLSEIGLGGWLTFGSVHDERSGRAVMDRALACGVNFFDTANVYAGGACETMWGKLLAAYPRASYVLATKVYFPMGEGPNDRGLSRKHIMEQCEASLRRLQTDCIDLYQCHRFDDSTPGQPLPAGSRATDERQNPFILERVRDQRTLEHVGRLHEVADALGCTLGQLALAWILSRPEITSCIVGATRPAQIEENAGASGIRLSSEQLARIDEIILPVTFSYDYR